jgi:hypothetical protein
MNYIQQSWRYVLTEPFTWLFYAFFQPARFKREYESKGIVNRTIAMLRLALPLFLCTYPPVLIVYLTHTVLPHHIFLFLVENLSIDRPLNASLVMVSDIAILLAIALATIVSIVWSVLWGIAGGIAGGIAWGIILSIMAGISVIGIREGYLVAASSVVGSFEAGTLYGLAFSTIFGVVGALVGSLSWLITTRRGIGKDVASGAVGGMVGGIVAGIVGTIVAGIALNIEKNMQGGVVWTTLAPVAGVLAGGIVGGTARPVAEKGDRTVSFVAVTLGAVTGGIGGILWGLLFYASPLSIWQWIGIVAGSIGVGAVGGVVGAIVLDIVETNDRRKNVTAGLMMVVVGSLFFGVTSLSSITNTMGVVMAIVMGATLGIGRPSTMSLVLAASLAIGRIENPLFLTPQGIRGSLIVNLVLVVSFILGYYRLPLYPISAFSTFRTYLTSRRNPSQVFLYLHRSSLYWDERVLLPLPGLKETLLLAATQHVERTQEEISFIIAERRQQIDAARAASLEIAIRDLEERQELREIAQASQRLTELLPQEAGLIDPRWVAPFARLLDASRDAARACSPLGWQARHAALQEMIANLKKVHHNTAFKDAQLNMRLGEVVKTWREAAQRGLETLEFAPEKTSRIDNPYNPGPALELHDSLFVGRRDLAQQLGEALGRGSRRPTFLLRGERRMGKSSTLKQLPDLLGARYLPIFYDLQMRGFSANIAIFLGKIAEEISKAMSIRGLPARKLPYEQLQEAGRRSETEVYYQFDRWFEFVESILEQADRTLLLAFDEFEKLEDAGERGQIDLPLLLDWFRSVMQNHPRLALLFSGVRSFEDMGTSWAGYFVNVQTLKVSFLQPAEAHQLITRPVPHFPSEQIFGERFAEAVMQVTNCHPFLVQAMCSALIDALNASKRTRIELPDVVTAADQVIKNWGSTYFRDLWERTNKDQRACIIALRGPGKCDLSTIEQRSGLDARAVHNALDTLIDRDIVVCEQKRYRIAVHLFRHWVERSTFSV